MVLAGAAVTTEQAEKQAKSEHHHDSNLSQAILQLAYSMNGRAGRTTLAQILCGSGAKKLKESGYTSLPSFGAFRAFKQDQLLDHIDDLVASADLRVSPGMYPKVQITQSGMGKLKDQALKD
jgi:superfamily II DNA helicase RecQ